MFIEVEQPLQLSVATDGFAPLQAVTLLLRGLELDAVLQLVAKGGPLGGSSLTLKSASARKETDAELSSWEAAPAAAHAPVALAWAAFAALVAQATTADGAGDKCSEPGLSGVVNALIAMPSVSGLHKLAIYIYIYIYVYQELHR